MPRAIAPRVLASLGLLALPKCPLCFLAFSSTLMVCGEAGVAATGRVHSSPVMATIVVLTSAVMLFITARNFRRAPARLLLALAGSVLLSASVFYAGGALLYYTGALAWLAVWWMPLWQPIAKRLNSLPWHPFNVSSSSSSLKA